MAILEKWKRCARRGEMVVLNKQQPTTGTRCDGRTERKEQHVMADNGEMKLRRIVKFDGGYIIMVVLCTIQLLGLLFFSQLQFIRPVPGFIDPCP